jgi:hypothetical protein
MTTPFPRRLIEVDLPIARISAHARREKSIRHGHISTLHIWWARRPRPRSSTWRRSGGWRGLAGPRHARWCDLMPRAEQWASK